MVGANDGLLVGTCEVTGFGTACSVAHGDPVLKSQKEPPHRIYQETKKPARRGRASWHRLLRQAGNSRCLCIVSLNGELVLRDCRFLVWDRRCRGNRHHDLSLAGRFDLKLLVAGADSEVTLGDPSKGRLGYDLCRALNLGSDFRPGDAFSGQSHDHVVADCEWGVIRTTLELSTGR